MAIKYINIFQSKALQKCNQIGILGLKINRLAILNLSNPPEEQAIWVRIPPRK
jgi:hypothetical protein